RRGNERGSLPRRNYWNPISARVPLMFDTLLPVTLLLPNKKPPPAFTSTPTWLPKMSQLERRSVAPEPNVATPFWLYVTAHSTTLSTVPDSAISPKLVWWLMAELLTVAVPALITSTPKSPP